MEASEWRSQIGTMSEICIERRIEHRVSFSLVNFSDPPKFHVTDDPERSGWVEIQSLRGLLQWIGSKGFA